MLHQKPSSPITASDTLEEVYTISTFGQLALCRPNRKLRVIVVRHGQTLYNRENRFRGLLDIPLDETGHQQARLSAAFLVDHLGIGRADAPVILTSPLSRARETAVPLTTLTGVEAVLAQELNDVNVGRWQGLLVTEVEQHQPEAYAHWTQRPAEFEFPEGDRMADVYRRGVDLMSRIAAREPQDTVLFTHQVPAKLLVSAAIGAGAELFWRLRVDNAAVSVLEYSSGSFALTLFNATAHLRML